MEMSQKQPYEQTPKGYKAVASSSIGACEGCAFYNDVLACKMQQCCTFDRKDGIDVIFVKEDQDG